MLDFGQEVGGFLTINFGVTSDASQSLGLSFSESTNYASCPSTAVGACTNGAGQAGSGDASNGGSGPDGILSTGPIAEQSAYSPSAANMRGGFRYINLFMQSMGSVEVLNVSLYFSPAPTMADPSRYANYFYSSDDLLNRIWYAAAYTVQMCTVDPSQGRQWGPPPSGWNNAVLIGSGKSLLVDGAKRDRTIWPGDLGVSVATAFVTTGDVESSRNALDTLFALQSPQGQLPYVGPAVFCSQPWGQSCGSSGWWFSDTYHLWALVGVSNVFRYSNDTAWLYGLWTQIKAGVDHSLSKVGQHGLMVVDQTADWARADQGGENVAANCLLHGAVAGASAMAFALGDDAAGNKYAQAAQALRTAINGPLLWDSAKGAFRDNPDSSLYPQDGNSLCVLFDAASADKLAQVADYLQTNWVALGALSPEWLYNNEVAIGTFPGSLEVMILCRFVKVPLDDALEQAG